MSTFSLTFVIRLWFKYFSCELQLYGIVSQIHRNVFKALNCCTTRMVSLKDLKKTHPYFMSFRLKYIEFEKKKLSKD